MNEQLGRSQIVQTGVWSFDPTNIMQSAIAISWFRPNVQTLSGQSEIFQSTTGTLTPDVESAKRPTKIKALL